MAELYLSPPMKDCVVLSLSFFFVYTAFTAVQNLQSSLNYEENLGVLSLAVLFGSSTVCAPLTNRLFWSRRPKTLMVVAWVMFIIYIASNFYPHWGTLIPSSVLLGAVIGPVCTTGIQCKDAMAIQHAELQGGSKDNFQWAYKKFSFIFFMCLYVTDISGNLVSSIILETLVSGSSSQTLDLCGANDCPWRDYSNGSSKTTEVFIEPDHSTVYILLGILLGFILCGLLLTIFVLKALERHGGTFRCGCKLSLLNPDMIPLTPLFVGEGIFTSMLIADYTKAFISCSLGVQWVGFVMTLYGLYSVLSANSFPKSVGRISMFVSSILLAIGSLVFMMSWQPSTEDPLFIMLYIVPSMAGVSQGIMKGQIKSFLGRVMAGYGWQAFASYQQTKNLSMSIALFVSMSVCLRKRLIVALCFYAVGFIGYVWTEFRLKRRAKASDDHEQGNYDNHGEGDSDNSEQEDSGNHDTSQETKT